MDIKKLRKSIDDIDEMMCALFVKRMDTAAEIAKFKTENSLPVTSESRENEVLERVTALVGDEFAPYAKELYETMFNASKRYQAEIMAKELRASRLENIEYGLVGGRLSHSYSPEIHACLGDYDYQLIELEENEVRDFFKAKKFKAVNVTIPYKKIAFECCDVVSDDTARSIGSVNTVVVSKSGRLHGYNTDLYGFEYMLRSANISPYGKKCIVLGSGGASVTAVAVLRKMGASSVTVISRTGSSNYENLHLHYDAEIIVNTTPVGMYPENGKSVIELAKFKNCTGVVDMIYNPEKTKLILDAERLSIPFVSGLPMLVAQAKMANERFFGRPLDDSVTEKVIKQISSEKKNITLIGMPGCGKSTIGMLISRMTGRELTDTDELIEKSTGRSPADIIKEDGENAFRKIESGVLADVSKESGKIIACGGGIVTVPSNIDLLRQNSTVFFINRDINDLDTKGRPLSSGGALPGLYATRLPLYRKACDNEIKFESSYQCASDIIRLAGLEKN